MDDSIFLVLEGKLSTSSGEDNSNPLLDDQSFIWCVERNNETTAGQMAYSLALYVSNGGSSFTQWPVEKYRSAVLTGNNFSLFIKVL